MRNDYARKMLSVRRDGIMTGLQAMTGITLIACANVLDEYMDGDKVGACCKDMEREMQRIWQQECRENPELAAELIVGHVEQLRKLYKMDEEDNGNETD